MILENHKANERRGKPRIPGKRVHIKVLGFALPILSHLS